MSQDSQPQERRQFITRFNTGLAALAAMAGLAKAQQKPASTARWEPVRHDKDDWLDIPAKHRVVIDATDPDGVGDALLWGSNIFRTNKSAYGVENSDMAVVIVLRHNATAFGYNDAMWAKYGAPLAARSKMEDPKTKQPPKLNIYNSADYRELPSMGNTLEGVAKLGGLFAICSLSTRGYAGVIARATGGKVDAIVAELESNLISSARMVPAGVITVTRAEERSYALVRA